MYRKEGKCACGYTGVLFAKGMCKWCYNAASTRKWKDKKRNTTLKERKPLKRTPVKKVSSKRASVVKKDKSIYDLLWSVKPHFCEECGCFLGNEPRPCFFSHILTKGAYPMLRWTLENFNILCLKHHNQWEFGDRKSMKIFSKNIPVIEKLKKVANEQT